LDLLEGLARRLEMGYEKLYRWTQAKARQLASDDVDLSSLSSSSSSPSSSSQDSLSLLPTALALLANMPVYRQHCSMEVGQGRRVVLLRRFINALSRPHDHVMVLLLRCCGLLLLAQWDNYTPYFTFAYSICLSRPFSGLFPSDRNERT